MGFSVLLHLLPSSLGASNSYYEGLVVRGLAVLFEGGKLILLSSQKL
jgi:hypothetical protein